MTYVCTMITEPVHNGYCGNLSIMNMSTYIRMYTGESEWDELNKQFWTHCYKDSLVSFNHYRQVPTVTIVRR